MLVSFVLVFFAALVSIPVGVILCEVIAGCLFSRRVPDPLPDNDFSVSIAVLVPAHNESAGLLPTLKDIKAQLQTGDRLLVVADNCSDDTGAIAAAAGAEVCVRNEPDRIGKGYALDRGIRYLGANPPDVVIVIDADCRLEKSAIAQLAVTCARMQRPVQALDLMTAPEGMSSHRMAEFAWRVKNWVRPLGLHALNLPCQLMGTGMAFPWNVIEATSLANSNIVEDLKLGLDLTLARHAPLFCPEAIVTSHFPLGQDAVASQRRRWEQGHLRTILAAPGLICSAIAHHNFELMAITLDMAVPPLSFLVLLVTGMAVLAGAAMWAGASSTPLFICATNLSGVALAFLLSWYSFGRDLLPPRAVFSIPFYVMRKLPLYFHVLTRRQVRQWIRTDRNKPPKMPL